MKTRLLILLIFLSAILTQCENPTKPDVFIQFQFLGGGQEISLYVFSASGNKIRTLVKGSVFAGGFHAYRWDGKTDKGEKVVEGIYYCRLEERGL